MELYLYEDLLKAENQDDLLEKTQRVVEKLEYEAFSYIFRSIDKVGKERKQTDCLFGTVPDGWLNYWVENKVDTFDPSIRHCLTRDTPVIWTQDLYSAPRAIDVYYDSMAYGVGGGASFPMRGTLQAGRGIFSLSRDEAPVKTLPFVRDTLAQGMLLAAFVNDVAQRIGFANLAKKAPAVKLTPRERECLLYSARGRTMADIAKILVRDHNTVIFHLANAYRKLGAANCTEAVAIAISRGLIVP